jgi:hypothetical protein
MYYRRRNECIDFCAARKGRGLREIDDALAYTVVIDDGALVKHLEQL